MVSFLTLWFLWCARNDAKHRGLPVHAHHIIHKVYSYIHTISRCNLWKPSHWYGDRNIASYFGIELPPPCTFLPKIVEWTKPSIGWVKLNTDGASLGNPGIAGAGGLLRDHKGQLIFAFKEPLGHSTNTMAEPKALHRGLLLSWQHGFSKIWVEVDATSIISLLSSEYTGLWLFQHILHHIQSLLNLMEVRITHIFREANQAADLLASEACEASHLIVIHGQQTQGHIRGILHLDSIGYPYFRFH